MQIIPILLPLMEDETLDSYFCRLARANNLAFDQMRPTVQSSAASFIPGSYNGIWPYLVNLGMQLEIDPIDLFLDHTTFCRDQMFLTRDEHKAFVRCLSDSEADQRQKRLTGEAWCCRQCAEADDSTYGFHYVHLGHQLHQGFCDKHLCPTSVLTLDNFIDGSPDVMPYKRIVPFKQLPSFVERNAKALGQLLVNDRTVLCYDDVSTIILDNFSPATLLISRTALALEDAERIFSGKDLQFQMEILSDAYYYLKSAESQGYSLADYPTILTALFEETIREKPLKDVLLPEDELFCHCVLYAARQGYRIETKLQPIMRVRNVSDGSEKIVSPFTILDEEIDKLRYIKD